MTAPRIDLDCGLTVAASGYTMRDTVVMVKGKELLGWWMPFTCDVRARRIDAQRWVPFKPGNRPEGATGMLLNPQDLKELREAVPMRTL